MITPSVAPSARAATTKSRVRSVSASARICRAMPAHPESARASTMLSSVGPNRPVTSNRRSKGGNARITSVSRISVASVRPPKYPAVRPTATPMTDWTRTAAPLTRNEMPPP